MTWCNHTFGVFHPDLASNDLNQQSWEIMGFVLKKGDAEIYSKLSTRPLGKMMRNHWILGGMKACFQKNRLDQCKIIVGMLEVHEFYSEKHGTVWDGMIWTWNYFGIWHTHLLPSFGNDMGVKEDRHFSGCSHRNFAATKVSLLLDFQTGSLEARLLQSVTPVDGLLIQRVIQGLILPILPGLWGIIVTKNRNVCRDPCQTEWSEHLIHKEMHQESLLSINGYQWIQYVIIIRKGMFGGFFSCGGFLKWGYPQVIYQKTRLFQYKDV